MNPYLIAIIVIPAFLSGIAGLIKRPIVKLTLLILATVIYWAILQKYVDWAYTHPFNPKDGGARTFAYLVGCTD